MYFCSDDIVLRRIHQILHLNLRNINPEMAMLKPREFKAECARSLPPGSDKCCLSGSEVRRLVMLPHLVVRLRCYLTIA